MLSRFYTQYQAFKTALSPVQGKHYRNALLIFLSTCLILAFFVPNSIINTDVCEYYRQISHAGGGRNSVHEGYLFLLEKFMLLSPFARDFSLNLFNVTMGGLSLGFVYLISVRSFGKSRVGIMAVLFLLSNFLFLYNALFAELYLPKATFMLASLFFVLMNWSAPGGLFLAISFAITPSSILALPFFIALGLEPRAILKFCLAFGIGIGLYFWINPAFFDSGRLGKAAFEGINLPRALLVEAHQLIRSYFLILPFVFWGLWE